MDELLGASRRHRRQSVPGCHKSIRRRPGRIFAPATAVYPRSRQLTNSVSLRISPDLRSRSGPPCDASCSSRSHDTRLPPDQTSIHPPSTDWISNSSAINPESGLPHDSTTQFVGHLRLLPHHLFNLGHLRRDTHHHSTSSISLPNAHHAWHS